MAVSTLVSFQVRLMAKGHIASAFDPVAFILNWMAFTALTDGEALLAVVTGPT